jgi:hypothetical protein
MGTLLQLPSFLFAVLSPSHTAAWCNLLPCAHTRWRHQHAGHPSLHDGSTQTQIENGHLTCPTTAAAAGEASDVESYVCCRVCMVHKPQTHMCNCTCHVGAQHPTATNRNTCTALGGQHITRCRMPATCVDCVSTCVPLLFVVPTTCVCQVKSLSGACRVHVWHVLLVVA